jgi:hypothetical protein
LARQSERETIFGADFFGGNSMSDFWRSEQEAFLCEAQQSAEPQITTRVWDPPSNATTWSPAMRSLGNVGNADLEAAAVAHRMRQAEQRIFSSGRYNEIRGRYRSHRRSFKWQH